MNIFHCATSFHFIAQNPVKRGKRQLCASRYSTYKRTVYTFKEDGEKNKEQVQNSACDAGCAHPSDSTLALFRE